MSGDWDTVGHVNVASLRREIKFVRDYLLLLMLIMDSLFWLFASRGVSDEPREKALNAKFTRVQEAER